MDILTPQMIADRSQSKLRAWAAVPFRASGVILAVLAVSAFVIAGVIEGD